MVSDATIKAVSEQNLIRLTRLAISSGLDYLFVARSIGTICDVFLRIFPSKLLPLALIDSKLLSTGDFLPPRLF